MKVGDYVRTINGKIWIIKSQKAISGHKKDIINTSYNIIDLIEVGDYVNEEKVLEVLIDGNMSRIKTELSTFFNNDIKSIVTKEQFENMEYKIER